MRLESARSLKEELWFNLHRTAMGRSEVLAQALSADGSAMPPPGVALGIVPGRKRDDFRLAIRLQILSHEARSYAAYVTGKAADEADVSFIGRVQAPPARAASSRYRKRIRPLAPGFSLGHVGVTAGTLGGFVVDAKGRPGILSNNHVLAANNAGKKGDAILQAGPMDGGTYPVDEVARLERFIRLRRHGNTADAAFALLSAGVEARPLYRKRRLTDVMPVEEIQSSLAVWKLGRTTGHTRGTVTAIEVDQVTVDYSGTLHTFDGQLEVAGGTRPFSQGGDSGALVVGGANRGVGLLFAGSEAGGPLGIGVSYANPLQTVLDLLGLELHEAG
ncbi:S1 family peptidase [Myxococcus sp. RHSTA-1-4]|uniref:S1 family peptidase n=1 Tax=Myxococcus sp. RHSTA-1-4 TaxID=2874601 RepID=UPI001CBDA533|nr:S1 family peptidase [Myxococcus sp. RHSTA-1-4]MBZ4421522.1 S1 family peptidase [Myxococcus sp. RHSTA-1-4]